MARRSHAFLLLELLIALGVGVIVVSALLSFQGVIVRAQIRSCDRLAVLAVARQVAEGGFMTPQQKKYSVMVNRSVIPGKPISIITVRGRTACVKIVGREHAV